MHKGPLLTLRFHNFSLVIRNALKCIKTLKWGELRFLKLKLCNVFSNEKKILILLNYSTEAKVLIVLSYQESPVELHKTFILLNTYINSILTLQLQPHLGQFDQREAGAAESKSC